MRTFNFEVVKHYSRDGYDEGLTVIRKPSGSHGQRLDDDEQKFETKKQGKYYE